MHKARPCGPWPRLMIALAVAATVLTACDSLKRHGVAASAFHAAYCEASEDRRSELELMLVFEDGSPKLDVHCEPHRAPDPIDHPPGFQ